LRPDVLSFERRIEYAVVECPVCEVSTSAVKGLGNCIVDLGLLLESPPLCLIHRDYHSWNRMVHNDAVAVIDFQDALLAPPHYDLASLLNDRVTDSIIRPDLEAQLLRYYLDRYNERAKQPFNRDAFFDTYLLAAIPRAC